MPAFAFRWYFMAHGVKGLARNVFGFCGMAPVRTSYVGAVDSSKGAARARWLEKLERLGGEGL